MTALLFLALFVGLPAAVAFISEPSLGYRRLFEPAFSIGTPLVYRQEEISTHPVTDACDVQPAERGDYYYYAIVNYLRVTEVLGDGRIIAVARNNQRLCFWPNDSSFRKARLTERLFYRPRFPHA
jgi:hypothetical protein